MVTNLSYLEFFRIKDWFYIVGLAFLGFFYKMEYLRVKDIFFLTIIASLYLAHGYSINNYFDFRVGNLPLFNQRFATKFSLERALIFSVALFVLNCSISFFYSQPIFALVILGACLSFLYSSSYTRLKSRPFFNIVINSTGFTILFLIGYLTNKPFTFETLYFSGYIWLGIIPSQIIHLIAHNSSEGNWLFPLSFSLKLFYLTHLFWIIWSFIIFYLVNEKISIFILTLLFCITQMVVIELNKMQKQFMNRILDLRNKFKLLNIIFGFILLSLILFSNGG